MVVKGTTITNGPSMQNPTSMNVSKEAVLDKIHPKSGLFPEVRPFSYTQKVPVEPVQQPF
jgi:hypothetical protein